MTPISATSKFILPIIVLSQFCCGSLWFAGNAIVPDLIPHFGLGADALGHITAAVQLGFIAGTLLFAFLTIADRFSPSKVFFVCALLGAFFNLLVMSERNGYESVLVLRFLVGFCLAGIYPVGMKIAADHFEKGLGKSLGLLVGALVLGTAFPHAIKAMGSELHWTSVLIGTSGMAVFGGLIMVLFVPDGPYRRVMQKLDLSAFFKVFRKPEFRAPAFGYFGHMWELYAFWAFVPVILKQYDLQHQASMNIPLLSFVVIAAGSLGCAAAGFLSQKISTKQIASIALLSSGVCCLVCPFIFQMPSTFLIISFLVFWGIMVVADSPLFSTLVAQNAPAETKGTALTIVNCIGFSITIISIELLNTLWEGQSVYWIFMLLAIGPALGLLGLLRKRTADIS